MGLRLRNFSQTTTTPFAPQQGWKTVNLNDPQATHARARRRRSNESANAAPLSLCVYIHADIFLHSGIVCRCHGDVQRGLSDLLALISSSRSENGAVPRDGSNFDHEERKGAKFVARSASCSSSLRGLRRLVLGLKQGFHALVGVATARSHRPTGRRTIPGTKRTGCVVPLPQSKEPTLGNLLPRGS